MASRGKVVEFLLGGIRDANGNPLNGGKVYTYSAGTLTPKNTYTDFALTSASANPIILDANGMKEVYADGAYKFIIKDSNDVQLYSYDNLNFSYDLVDTLYGVTSGSGTAYTLSLSPAPGALFTGMMVMAKFHAACGAGATLNVNGLGAVAIVKYNGEATLANDLVLGQLATFVYDGTNWLIVDGAANGYYQNGATSGVINTASTSLVAYTNSGLTVATKTGDKVLLTAQLAVSVGGGTGTITATLARGGTPVGAVGNFTNSRNDVNGQDGTIALSWIDAPSAGTNTYALYWKVSANTAYSVALAINALRIKCA